MMESGDAAVYFRIIPGPFRWACGYYEFLTLPMVTSHRVGDRTVLWTMSRSIHAMSETGSGAGSVPIYLHPQATEKQQESHCGG